MLSFILTLRRLIRATARSWDDPEFRALATVFVLLLISGTACYATIEGWSVLDALYFSMTTLSTVGYGDFRPETSFGKVFTIAYIPVGIGVFVALAAKLAMAVTRKPSTDDEREKDS